MNAKCESIWPPNPTTFRASTVHLSVDRKSKKICYANGQSIYVRSIVEPYDNCVQYSDHRCQTTVAKFSPSGTYIASADVKGRTRIWNVDGDHILKLETQNFNGKVTDLAWDGDSKRIIAVGDGKEKYGHCFLLDTGTSIGEILGHSAIVNAVSIRKQQPLRAATAADDGQICFFHGAPFKFNKKLSFHSRFVLDLAFSPDGKYLVSVGADSKIFLFDGLTGEKISEIKEENSNHKGSIFAVSWDQDSVHIATASADGQIKIWNVEKLKLERTLEHSIKEPKIDFQQVGIIWIDENLIVSLSYRGDLFYWRPQKAAPERIIEGHQRSITAMVLSSDKEKLVTASYDGKLVFWDLSRRSSHSLKNMVHRNLVSNIVPYGDKLISVSMDDTLRISNPKTLSVEETEITFNFQPLDASALDNNRYVVITVSNIQIFQGDNRVAKAKTNYLPVSVDVNHKNGLFAIGAENKTIYIYEFDTAILEVGQLQGSQAGICKVKFAPNGNYLAAGDASGKIFIYETLQWQKLPISFCYHTGRVTGISWNAESNLISSCSLDTNLNIYSITPSRRHFIIHNAHFGGCTAVCWSDTNKLISTGSDACIKIWDIELD